MKQVALLPLYNSVMCMQWVNCFTQTWSLQEQRGFKPFLKLLSHLWKSVFHLNMAIYSYIINRKVQRKHSNHSVVIQ